MATSFLMRNLTFSSSSSLGFDAMRLLRHRLLCRNFASQSTSSSSSSSSSSSVLSLRFRPKHSTTSLVQSRRGLQIQTYPSLTSEVKLEKPKLLQFGKEDVRWTRLRSLVDEYPMETPIEEAWTPPASWYTEPEFLSFEKKAIFEKCWQYACHVDAVKNPGDFYAGTILGEHFLVVRGSDGELRAFHNVCRHHATVLSPPGTSHHSGNAEQFKCCYHGWTYGLDGRLLQATKLKGIKNFSAKDFGLKPLPLSTWGPYVFVWIGEPDAKKPNLHDDLAPVQKYIDDMNFGDLGSLRFVSREVHIVNCNWKIVNDNYLDGEYHIPHVHNGLASVLEMKTYKVDNPNLYVSMQIGEPSKKPAPERKSSSQVNEGQDFADRIGDRGAVYALVYPNFAINRYGPMLDTNLVIPLSSDRSAVIFDYFFEEDYIKDTEFLKKSIAASRKVQEEDTMVCELVQEGLSSRAYNKGRYSPSMETATFHFHQFLATHLRT